MLAKLARHETRVLEFLQSLGDRREWTVKMYLDEAGQLAASQAAGPRPLAASQGQGTAYLTSRRLENTRRQEIQAAVRRDLLAVANALGGLADTWRELNPLKGNLVDRPQPMVWNAAFLPARAREGLFRTACGRLQAALAPKGLALTLSGPWPAYHFCPALDAEDAMDVEGDRGAAAPAGR